MISYLVDFSQPADKVAQTILGQILVRRFSDGKIGRYLITEVEAYVGEVDQACHAHKGKTKRTAVMYGPAGHWYVYLIYGVYEMLNLVTDQVGSPHAVLFRSLEVIDHPISSKPKLNGPGKLTDALSIDRSFNTLPADKKTGLWLEAPLPQVKLNEFQRLPRIGVDYAGKWKDKPLRFRLKKSVINSRLLAQGKGRLSHE